MKTPSRRAGRGRPIKPERIASSACCAPPARLLNDAKSRASSINVCEIRGSFLATYAKVTEEVCNFASRLDERGFSLAEKPRGALRDAVNASCFVPQNDIETLRRFLQAHAFNNGGAKRAFYEMRSLPKRVVRK